MSKYLKPADRRKLEGKLRRLERRYDPSSEYMREAQRDLALVGELLQAGIIDRAHAEYLKEDIIAAGREANTERKQQLKDREEQEWMTRMQPRAAVGIILLFVFFLIVLSAI